MKIQHLEYFLEVVKQGSINRASEKLYVSQPSISRQIKELEEELGVTLFTRTARGVIPTEAGERAYAEGLSILRQLEEMKVRLREERVEPSGPVSLGLPQTLSAVLSLPLMEKVLDRTPKVSLRIVESLSGFIRDWLYAGKLDLGVLYRAEKSSGLILEPFIAENLYLVTLPETSVRRSEGSPLAGEGEVEFDDVWGEGLVLPAKPHGLRELIEKAARENHAKMKVSVEIDALELIKQMVMRGHGSSILPLASVYREVARGVLRARRIVHPQLTRTAYFARLSEKVLPHAAVAVKELMKQCASDLSAEARWTCNFS